VFDGTDTIVLFDELAYEDVLSVVWQPRPAGFTEASAQRLSERNLRLLLAHDALDEPAVADKPDDTSSQATEFARLDFKINLLLDLVGQLFAASSARPVALPVRLNSLGASWQPANTPPSVGAAGLLQVHLLEALVQPLSLPGKVVAVADSGLVRVRFELVGEAVADQLEKLVFRRHRRQIAGARTPRRG
jgi:hypothetical protein